MQGPPLVNIIDLTGLQRMPSLKEIINSGVKLTPMMIQYSQIKNDFPDTLLLFRMGDFYELFFEDAKEAARLLNITLTHRGKLGGHPIPMAGIPHHAATTYIDRITSQGLKAAICEQIEDPKMAKGIVKRAVTQVVSPGMPFDLEKTNQFQRQYMAAATKDDDQYYLILIDFITGDFIGLILESEKELIDKLQLYSPREFITFFQQWDDNTLVAKYLDRAGILATNLDQTIWDSKESDLYIKRLIPSYKRHEVLKQHPAILAPIGGLSYYICSTQSIEELYHIRPFKLNSRKNQLVVTLPTLTGLEILPQTRENYKSSLLGHFDNTKTSMGTRELRNQFLTPSRDKTEINNRQNLIELLLKDQELLTSLREELAQIRDLERILAKVSTKRANPSDLINLANSIDRFVQIKKSIKLSKDIFPILTAQDMAQLKELSTKISQTINDEIGASLDKGNLIRPKASKKRDQLALFSQDATAEVLKLEAKYRKSSKISNLKIKFNNVNGYFIEISKSHLAKVPKNFERKQTLTNAERFLTNELNEFEKEVVTAKDKLARLEREIFNKIVKKIYENSPTILKLAKIIGILDVFQSFAHIAFQENFVRPQIVDGDDGQQLLEVKSAWHPLIKASIKEQFICHDILLDSQNFFGLITGPNMAGKTTVMREMAIIQFLAQLGSFVPAKAAKLGLCDFLFSRLGASDDIVKGQSTFMVEMAETSEIVSHATSNSMIILDEIGRGTSTYDGLSIAWSLVEHLINKTKAICLFSTHYHELIDLVDRTEFAKNFTVDIINDNGDVQFLYNLIEKGAAQSFGIHVAKLAGLPKEILFRAQQILKKLEADKYEKRKLDQDDQLSIFDGDSPEIPDNKSQDKEQLKCLQELQQELSELDILNMTPIQAIAKLHELKTKLI